ncbi:hypothetical protein EV201_2341 [Ancylomarina subtilis]|uniref:Uncharacterized protein n=1 Tax=Ancylomarina subtilis TaxID=1639035 RepID=A0A4V2FS71_9BACT|nr:hypothetical protein EV201_2341 [Ancylomarina subtilis]
MLLPEFMCPALLFQKYHSLQNGEISVGLRYKISFRSIYTLSNFRWIDDEWILTYQVYKPKKRP